MIDLSRYRVFILCEDQEHNYFIRTFFKSLGVGDRKFDTYPLVDGSRSAEGHVRERLPEALDKIRKNRENVFLVVVSDADKNNPNLSDRVKQWNEELHSRGLPVICKEDRILCLVPKRNIETWFAWIDGEEAIDETKDYKQRYRRPKAGDYGKRFFEKYTEYRSRDTRCDDAPRSVRDACTELGRFCDALDKHERRKESSA